MSPKSNDASCKTQKRRKHREEGGHVKTGRDRSDAATSKEGLELAEAGRGRKDSPLRAFRGSEALQTP